MPLSQDDRKTYKDLYIKTATDYVKQLQKDLQQLRVGKETSDIIDSIHRCAHSLRGQSDMMGYPSMKDISSMLEKIFDAKKVSKMVFSDEVLKIFENAVKAMEECLTSIQKSGEESDVE